MPVTSGFLFALPFVKRRQKKVAVQPSLPSLQQQKTQVENYNCNQHYRNKRKLDIMAICTYLYLCAYVYSLMYTHKHMHVHIRVTAYTYVGEKTGIRRNKSIDVLSSRAHQLRVAITYYHSCRSSLVMNTIIPFFTAWLINSAVRVITWTSLLCSREMIFYCFQEK